MIDKYKRRIERYKQLLVQTKKPIKKVITIKLSLLALMLIDWVIAYEVKQLIVGLGGFVILIIAYIYTNIQHQNLLEHKADILNLININQDCLKRFSGEWRNFPDDGKAYVNREHAYALDLDIVGKDSLYQWTNMCETPWGRQQLINTLLHQDLSKEDIVNRQEAISELSNKLNFRHRLKLETRKLNIKDIDARKLVSWGNKKESLYQELWFVLIIRSLPLITIVSIICGPVMGVIPSGIAGAMVILQSALLYRGRKSRRVYLDSIYNSYRSIRKLKHVLGLIEKHKFQSTLLDNVRKTLVNTSDQLPSKQISNLSTIANNISNRRSSIYFVINVLLLWDYQCCISLEKWKEHYGEYLQAWFDSIGLMEALSSLARIKYDHADWMMPVILDDKSKTYVRGEAVGHPLLGQACVTNSIEFNDSMPIVLVTGSNMSGKSTFLRTIGVNLVLAYCGAPVFAKEFECSKMTLATCMRVSDDLQQNISSFYGEILRIKMIIEKVKSGNKVFFILDEIFKGTNSIDRHFAAKAVIHNLNKYHASGMVSTHDLELEVIEDESKHQVMNYHFEEAYEEGKITFDYKLKSGVSQTRNAIYLIKAAGIDID